MDNEQQLLKEEMKAMENIVNILSKLDNEARARVIDWVMDALKIKALPKVSQQNQGEKPTKTYTNIEELWNAKDPKTNHQKFAVLGYHLEFHQSKKEFNLKDLTETWKKTRDPLPKKRTLEVSLNDTITKYNYLVKGSKRGIYKVGRRGKLLVEALPNPPKDLKGSVKKKSSRKFTKKK